MDMLFAHSCKVWKETGPLKVLTYVYWSDSKQTWVMDEMIRYPNNIWVSTNQREISVSKRNLLVAMLEIEVMYIRPDLTL
jgi:hypothetical protein